MENEKIFCSNCGKSIDRSASFCTHCGVKNLNLISTDDEQTVSIFEKGDSNYVSQEEKIPNVQPHNNEKDMSENKSKKKGIVIGIIVAVLLILIIIGSTAEKSLQGRNEGDLPTEYDFSETEKILDELEDSELSSVKEYSKGVLTSSTYSSSFCELQFANPEGWVMLSEDELEEQFNSNPEQYVYELATVSSTSQERVFLMIEKLPTKNFTVEQYMKAVAANNASAGVSVISDDSTRIIAGETYNVINADVTDAATGISAKTDYYMRKIEDRIVCIMAVYLPGNQANIEPVLNAFSKY